MQFSEAHIKFLNWLELIKNKSPKTVEQYNRHLEKFRIFLHSKKVKDLSVEKIDLTLAEEFRTFVYKNSARQISIKTVNAYMITLRSFLKYLEKTAVKSLSPTSIDLIKEETRQVEFLSTEEIDRLFLVPVSTALVGARDLAIMECIYSTWLRISELVWLNVIDINLEKKEFVVRGKWRKLRIVYLTDQAVTVINNYLEKRHDNFWPLFIRHNYKHEEMDVLDDEWLRLTRFYITKMIKRHAVKACILKDISAHTLRHSFATTLLNNWADLRAIQELLWHASITTTQVYTHVTNPKLKEIHQKYMDGKGER